MNRVSIQLRIKSKPSGTHHLQRMSQSSNYYSKFLENLSSKLSPLYVLLHKNTKWHWGKEQQEAFQAAKEALQKDSFLNHFDPAKRLVLACDASNYGLGAVLSHVMDDGQERPVAFVSRTMNVAGKKYSQLEKEALAVVFGVKKFHTYLYGRSFGLEADHQPLLYLLNELRRIPQMASSRIQRWALTLAPYHPSTNGLAERALQSFKQALKRMSGGSIQVKLSNYLFKYRITPHATTGVHLPNFS